MTIKPQGAAFSVALLFLYHNLFAQEQFSAGIERLDCGTATITLDTRCADDLPGIRFVQLHENEQTATQVAYSMLAKYNRGCFVTWQCYGDRYINFKIDTVIYKFDPNRIFTAQGRRETLTANGEYSEEADSIVAGIAAIFLANYIDSQRLVIALHNNTDNGGLTINSYRKHGDYAADAKKVHVNKSRDQDDFFLTTDEHIYKYIKKRGYNILLQDNKHVTDDGSLSVYASQHNIPYLNIEAEHGHLQQQIDMTDLAQQMINDLFKL